MALVNFTCSDAYVNGRMSLSFTDAGKEDDEKSSYTVYMRRTALSFGESVYSYNNTYGTQFNWIFTVDGEFQNWINPNATSANIDVRVKETTTNTYSEWVSVTLYPDISAITGGTITITNISQNQLLHDNNIANASDFSVSWSGAKPTSGATISRMQISIAAQTFTIPQGSIGASGTLVLPQKIFAGGTVAVNLEVTDSRGYIGTASTLLEMISYNSPIVESFNAARCDSTGQEQDKGTYLKSSARWSIVPIGNGDNVLVSAVLGIEDGAYGSGTFVTKSTTISGNTMTLAPTTISGGGYLSDRSYRIKITIQDTIGQILNTQTEAVIVVGTEDTLMDFLYDGTGIAIGKVAELQHTFDVNMPTKFTIGNNALLQTSEDNSHNGKIWLGNTANYGLEFDASLGSQKLLKRISSNETQPIRTIFVSDSSTTPSGGEDGDLWFRYST